MGVFFFARPFIYDIETSTCNCIIILYKYVLPVTTNCKDTFRPLVHINQNYNCKLYVRSPRAVTVTAATQCCTVPHSAAQYRTVLHSAKHCHTVLHSTTQCCTVPHSAKHCRTLPHSDKHCRTVLHSTTQYHTVLHSTIQCHTVLYNTTQCCTVPNIATQCCTLITFKYCFKTLKKSYILSHFYLQICLLLAIPCS